MFRSIVRHALATIFICATSQGVLAEGDQDAGRTFFNQKCGGCHSLSADNNHYAPNLNCLIGRKAGTAPFPPYTDDMEALAEAGLVWDEENLDSFLADPGAFVRTTLQNPDAVIMMQVAVVDAKDRGNVLAYLASRCR